MKNGRWARFARDGASPACGSKPAKSSEPQERRCREDPREGQLASARPRRLEPFGSGTPRQGTRRCMTRLGRRMNGITIRVTDAQVRDDASVPSEAVALEVTGRSRAHRSDSPTKCPHG